MAFHNSVGANFGKRVGIERVILARELTYRELENIKHNSINILCNSDVLFFNGRVLHY